MIMEKYIVYSRELDMYVGEGNALTENEDEAKAFERIGDAMRCASEAMNSGNIFHVFSLEME